MKREIPQIIKAGLTFDIQINRPEFAGEEYLAVLYLRGVSSVNLSAEKDSGTYRFYSTAEETTLWKPGVYTYSFRILKGADVREIEAGTLQIVADVMALPEGHDGRSSNRKILDAITAVIEKRATQDQERYKINNRELWRTPLPDLLALRAHYASLVAAEEAKASGKSLWRPAVKVIL